MGNQTYVLYQTDKQVKLEVEICKALNAFSRKYKKYPNIVYLNPEIYDGQDLPIEGPGELKVFPLDELSSPRYFGIAHSEDKDKITQGELSGNLKQWKFINK